MDGSSAVHTHEHGLKRWLYAGVSVSSQSKGSITSTLSLITLAQSPALALCRSLSLSRMNSFTTTYMDPLGYQCNSDFAQRRNVSIN